MQLRGSPVCYSLMISQIFAGAVAVITLLIYLIASLEPVLADIFALSVKSPPLKMLTITDEFSVNVATWKMFPQPETSHGCCCVTSPY